MSSATPLPVALAALRYSLADLNQSNDVRKDEKGDHYILLVHANTGHTYEITYHNEKYALTSIDRDTSAQNYTTVNSLHDAMKELGAGADVLAKVDGHLKVTQARYDAHMQARLSPKM